MFNIQAFLKFVNVNNDDVVSKKEIEDFVNSQTKDSIFTNYFKSIDGDVGLDIFKKNIEELDKQFDKRGDSLGLKFNNEKYENKYNEIIHEQFRAEYKNRMKACYLCKCENEAEFDKLYDKFMEECKTSGLSINDYFQKLPIKRPITVEEYILGGLYGLNFEKQLDDIDWSKSKEMFKYLNFTSETFSNTSKEHLPDGYNPDEVIEKGMTIGLSINRVHEKGYTGKGVSVAICDWQLKPHNDLNIKEYTCEETASKKEEYMHGSAVTSILAGQKTGVAPDCDVYYFAERQDESITGGNDMISTFKSILEKNKTLPDSQKIRVVSISGPLYGGEEVVELAQQLTDSGVWVFSSDEFWKNFGYTSKIDAMGNPDDFSNYQVDLGDDNPDALYVNSGDRTVASPDSETAYRHDSMPSASWAIPVVAGYYALACQADSTMTPEKFIQLSGETAQVIDSTKPIREGSNVVARSEDTIKIKMIDIDALLTKIEQNQNN